MCELIRKFNELPVSERIQIIATLTTMVGIVVSLIFAIFTLRQNNKFKREEARANIVCFIEHITKTSNSYIVIKNFGKSIGRVIDVTLAAYVDIDKIVGITDSNFENILKQKNYILAPDQKISSFYNFIDYDIDDFTVTISYETLGKTYKEEFLLKPRLAHNVVSTVKTSSNYNNTENLLSNMNESLREISEKI